MSLHAARLPQSSSLPTFAAGSVSVAPLPPAKRPSSCRNLTCASRPLAKKPARALRPVFDIVKREPIKPTAELTGEPIKMKGYLSHCLRPYLPSVGELIATHLRSPRPAEHTQNTMLANVGHHQSHKLGTMRMIARRNQATCTNPSPLLSRLMCKNVRRSIR